MLSIICLTAGIGFSHEHGKNKKSYTGKKSKTEQVFCVGIQRQSNKAS